LQLAPDAWNTATETAGGCPLRVAKKLVLHTKVTAQAVAVCLKQSDPAIYNLFQTSTAYMTSMFWKTSAHSGGKVPCTGDSHLLYVFHGVKSFVGMSAVLP
jgi:hypothetical protein